MSEHGAAQLPKPGDVIAGKYALERIIGQGGMGAVFAARHVKLGHAVAIKVMLADRQNEEAARRFMNEGRASAHIQNEHVVRIFDIDEEHGYAYMVLELLQGDDLAQVLEAQGRLASHVAVGYVIQALDGVRQAHALGIVHRDLKPSNLFLARTQSGNVVVKVLDFGISKARGASSLDMAPHQQTSTAAMLGSPLYMSPEQLRSSKNVDARADIWAMGVILYELLTGQVPFEGETLGALFSAILETDAPRVSARVRDVPAGLDAIIVRCLQRRPEDRFATVADLEQELAPFAIAQATSFPLMMTAAMPPSVSAAAAAAVSGPMQHGTGSQGGAPYAGAMNARLSHAASVSGSGPHGLPGTVPLGASTPQPYQQTGSTWQSTGSGTRPKSTTGLVIGVLFGSLALAGIGVAGFVHWRNVPHPIAALGSSSGLASGSGPGSAAPSTDPVPATATPVIPAIPTATASSAVTAPTTPASAAVTPPATKRPPTTTTTAATAKVEPKPPPPVETAKVEPPRPPPHATAAPTGGVPLQSR
jgi:serine/threonine protein kinase